MVMLFLPATENPIPVGREDAIPRHEGMSPLLARSVPRSGVHRLMVAVLTQAMNEYLEPNDTRSPTARHRRHQARRWIERADETPGPFSFTAVCDALGLDAKAVRGALWAKTQPPMPATSHTATSAEEQEVA